MCAAQATEMVGAPALDLCRDRGNWACSSWSRDGFAATWKALWKMPMPVRLSTRQSHGFNSGVLQQDETQQGESREVHSGYKRVLSTWGQSGSGTGCPAWGVGQSSSLEVFKSRVTCSGLRPGPAVGWTRDLLRSLPASSVLWSYLYLPLVETPQNLSFREKSWLAEKEPSHNGKKFVNTKAAGFLNLSKLCLN